jgi:hypothetical protein
VTGAERIGSDTKDYDITGAKFINGDGNDIFNAIFLAGVCLGY